MDRREIDRVVIFIAAEKKNKQMTIIHPGHSIVSSAGGWMDGGEEYEETGFYCNSKWALNQVMDRSGFHFHPRWESTFSHCTETLCWNPEDDTAEDVIHLHNKRASGHQIEYYILSFSPSPFLAHCIARNSSRSQSSEEMRDGQ